MKEEVERLWSPDILSSDSPKAPVFSWNGVNFALRDSKHYRLKSSQITKMPNKDGYAYCEYGSKENCKISEFQTSESQYINALQLKTGAMPITTYLNFLFLCSQTTLYMWPLGAIPAAAHLQ